MLIVLSCEEHRKTFMAGLGALEDTCASRRSNECFGSLPAPDFAPTPQKSMASKTSTGRDTTSGVGVPVPNWRGTWHYCRVSMQLQQTNPILCRPLFQLPHLWEQGGTTTIKQPLRLATLAVSKILKTDRSQLRMFCLLLTSEIDGRKMKAACASACTSSRSTDRVQNGTNCLPSLPRAIVAHYDYGARSASSRPRQKSKLHWRALAEPLVPARPDAGFWRDV